MSNFGELLCVVHEELHMRVYYTGSDGQESVILLDNGMGGVLDPEACEFNPMTTSTQGMGEVLDPEAWEFVPMTNSTQGMGEVLDPEACEFVPMTNSTQDNDTELDGEGDEFSSGYETSSLEDNGNELNPEASEFMPYNDIILEGNDIALNPEALVFMPGNYNTSLEETKKEAPSITERVVSSTVIADTELIDETPPPSQATSPMETGKSSSSQIIFRLALRSCKYVLPKAVHIYMTYNSPFKKT